MLSHGIDALGEFAVNLAPAQPQLLFDLLDGQPVDTAVGEYGIDAGSVAARGRVRAQPFDAVEQRAAQLLRLAQPVTVAAGGPPESQGVGLQIGVVIQMRQCRTNCPRQFGGVFLHCGISRVFGH
ncbi:MAG: hypothetical protein KDE24_28110 [Caldilinea sp.]|nr:hypothetical protein [Caldilinea sp.]